MKITRMMRPGGPDMTLRPTEQTVAEALAYSLDDTGTGPLGELEQMKMRIDKQAALLADVVSELHAKGLVSDQLIHNHIHWDFTVMT